MSEDNEPYNEGRDPLLCELDNKALEFLEIFETVPQQLQMDGLDILQGIVNTVINTITHGKVKTVKFVPIEETSTTVSSTSASQEGSRKNNSARNTNGASQNDSFIDHGSIVDNHHNSIDPNDSGLGSELNATVKEEPESDHEEIGSLESMDISPEPMATVDQKSAIVCQVHFSKKLAQKKRVMSYLEPSIKRISSHTKKKPKGPRGPPPTFISQTVIVPQLQPKRKVIGEETILVNKDSKIPKKKYICEECPYSSDTESHLTVHKLVHTKEKDFRCFICFKKFGAPSSLKRHIMAHEDDKRYTCKICDKKFICNASLKTHSTVHTGVRAFKCDQCDKRYTNSANLSRHKRVHTGEMPYHCLLCDAKYRDMSSLSLHKLKHTGEKPFECSVCNKRFKTSSDYRRHERIHTGERRYECKLCGRKFIQGWHLTQHERMHSDYRPWECEKCGKKFRGKDGLLHHLKGHAGIKDYLCTVCGKAFSSRSYLHNHQVTHTDEKPFACTVCGDRFNQISNMRRHMRIHSNKTMYQCRHCPKSFKYINSYRYHEGTHTAKMINCYKCGLVYRSKIAYQGHECCPEKYTENAAKAMDYIKRYKERKRSTPIIKTSMIHNMRNHTADKVKTLTLKPGHEDDSAFAKAVAIGRPKRQAAKQVISYKEVDAVVSDGNDGKSTPLDMSDGESLYDIEGHSNHSDDLGERNVDDTSNGTEAVTSLMKACSEFASNIARDNDENEDEKPSVDFDDDINGGRVNGKNHNTSTPIKNYTRANDDEPEFINIKPECLDTDSDEEHPVTNIVPLKRGFLTTTTVMSSSADRDTPQLFEVGDDENDNDRSTSDYSVLKVV